MTGAEADIDIRWRPGPMIRVKAIGLLWQGERLLAAEVYDDAGRLKGVRPLGGSVEFGERANEAVIREFREELGLDVSPIGAPKVMENIFIHEGVTGHEVMFVFDVSSAARLPSERIFFTEDSGARGAAGWYALADLKAKTPELFPSGLAELLPG